jgi:hypothetical protein
LMRDYNISIAVVDAHLSDETSYALFYP